MVNHPTPKKISLERFLVLCGQGSRRHCGWLVRQGRVTINGHNLKDAKKKISMDSLVALDGQNLKPAPLQTWLLHKPPGFICQTGENAPAALDLLPKSRGLGLIGRLDQDSEGLILATNDGDLSHQLTHPQFHVPKIYKVLVDGLINETILEKLCSGLPLEGKPTLPLEGRILQSTPHRSWIKLTLTEGRKRQIRKLCEIFELNVLQLIRTQLGPIKLGKLKSGDVRQLAEKEVNALQSTVSS